MIRSIIRGGLFAQLACLRQAGWGATACPVGRLDLARRVYATLMQS